MKKNQDNKVIVAISGGVDSAVSCLLMQKQGFLAEGVHFIFHKDHDSRNAAIKVARQLKMKLHIKDLSEKFRKDVIKPFVDEYKKGRTPNPCVICNPRVKFSELATIADELGINSIATGHYAQKIENKECTSLLKAVDEKKDQSYFLYRLKQSQLKRACFPLGKLSKKETRAIAKKHCLTVDQKESQDACFFQIGQKLENFLEKYISAKKGIIKNEKGDNLGEHSGSFMFTIGQRQGLGLSGGPFYVIGKDNKKNIVIVSKNSEHPALMPRKIVIKNTSWICSEPKNKKRYFFKTRYSSIPVAGMITKKSSRWEIQLAKPQWATAPGQSCVVYDKNKIMGGGIIQKCN